MENQSLVVTTAADVVNANDGVTSLREAITYARSLGGEQTVTFAKDLDIQLSETLSVTEDITIDGGSFDVRITGTENAPVFDLSMASLTLKNMTVRSSYRGNEAGIVSVGTDSLLTLYSVKDAGEAAVLWETHGNAQIFAYDSSVLHAAAVTTDTSVWGTAIIKVFESAYLEGITVAGQQARDGGDFELSGHAKDITVLEKGDFNIYEGAIADDIVVENNGWVVHYSGGTANGLTVEYGGIYEYRGSAVLNGTVILGGVARTNEVTGNSIVSELTDVVFDLTERTEDSNFAYSHLHPGHGLAASGTGNLILDQMSAFTGAGSYAVNVAADQAYGTYRLAGNAAGFNSAMSLTIGENTYKNALTVGSSYTVGGWGYSLGLNDSNELTLTVEAVPPDPLVVTTAADVVNANDGVTSLREAITYARSLGGEQTVTFAKECSNIGFSLGEIQIQNYSSRKESITVSGSTDRGTILDDTDNTERFFRVSNTSDAIFRNLTFRNGWMYDNAGAILNFGITVIDNCTFENNRTDTSRYYSGGAVHSGNWGSAITTIKNSEFYGNSASQGGGALWNDGLTCLVENCIFSGNTAALYGGAIYNTSGQYSDSTMTIKDCIFATSTDSIYNQGDLTLQGTISLAANFYTDQIVDAAGATINYLISAYGSSNSTVLISDQTRISGGSYQVTVAENQTEGTYLLAGNAAGFNSAVSLTIGENTYKNALTVGSSYTVGGWGYSLGLNDSNELTFSISASTDPVSDSTAGDLNGDGRADIVMTISQNAHGAYGATGAWLIQADQTAAWGDLTTRNSLWTVFGMGFTAAGKNTADVYAKSIDNVIGAWTTGNDGKVNGWETIGEFSNDTQILGLGDFNGNGQSDLLLRNTNGAVGCFFTGGGKTGWNYFQSLGDEWQLCAIGDLNGDGRDDVVLKHDAGFAGSWLTQADGTMAWADLDTLPEGFEIVGSGDFDGDGTDDVLLQKGNYFGAWLVYNGNARAWMGLGDLGDVTVEQIADFNGDGKDDLRIRTSAGDIGTQLVMGEDNLVWKYYGSVGSEWSTSLAALA